MLFIDNAPFDLTYYQLKIKDLDGKINLSKVISIKRNGFENNKIKVFPNPTQGILTLITDFNFEYKTINIVNTLGQVVYSENNINQSSININHLPNGVYFLKMGDEMGRFVKF